MRKMRLSGARKKCDKKLSNLELQIKKFYKLQEYQLTRSWQEYMKKGNAKIDKAWKDYEDAKATGDEDLIRKTGIAHRKAVEEYTLQNQHYKNMVNETAEQMAHAYDNAIKIINGELPEMYTISYNAVGEATKSIVKGYSFELMDREVARNLLIGNKEYMNYFKQANIPKSKRWNKKLIHSQMSQGIMQGESIDKLANRIYHVVGSNSKSAVLHARTMTTGIENRGRQDGFDKAEEDGIVIEKGWDATADNRTRGWHLELDGVEIPNNEKFENEYGDISFPGDADADAEPANIYNCRCALYGVVKGFRRADGSIIKVEDSAGKNGLHYKQIQEERARREQEKKPTVEKININEATTREEAYEVLNTMFSSISDNVKNLDEQLLCENVNQLKKLNSKFGAITGENKGYITASPSKKAIAYTSGTFAPNPKGELIENTNLGLVGKYYKNKKILIDEEKEAVKSFWSMPIKEENYAIYAITHEYGHMLENRILVSRTDYNAIKEKISMYNPALQRKEYQKIEKKGAKEIYNEIIGIAKENNPDFSIKDNLSRYGHTNHFEFFAETFANSQLGKPNELGVAMQQWLKKEGY